MSVYKWKDSVRFSADVDAIGEELEGMEKLDPESIVHFAENEETELHKCFTWDDYKAAHMYRLTEARAVVNSIVIVDDTPDEPIEYRAYESVIHNGERQYMPIKVILDTEELKEQVLGEIWSSISELSKKAKTYKYLAEEELNAAQYHLDLAREAVAL